jgi:predicted transcriptional regulator
MPRKTSRRAQEISTPRQIRVLASPVRQDIVETVDAAGPCSVAELARLLGMPADGLYYHIRRLSSADLLKAVNAKSKRGRGEARLEVGSYQWIKYRQYS